MNRNKLVLCLLAILFLVNAVVVSDVTAAWIPPVDADVCWGGKGAIARIRFINVGGGYYQLAGKTTGTSGTRAIFGSAVEASTEFYMSTTLASSTAAETFIETHRMVLNRTTLALKGEAMVVLHDKAESDPKINQTQYIGLYTLPNIICP